MQRLLPLLLLVAACDSHAPDASDTTLTYSTRQAEFASGVTDLGGGRLLVWGDVEGRPRPADGTNAYPAALPVDGEGVRAPLVYRAGGFGGAAGAVIRPDGATALLARLYGESEHTNTRGPSGLRLVVFDPDGSSRVVYARDGVFAHGDALRNAPDGGYYVLEDGAQGGLVRLDASGRERWRYRPAAPLQATLFEVAEDGTAYVLGVSSPSNPADAVTVAVLAVTPDGSAKPLYQSVRAREAWATYAASVRVYAGRIAAVFVTNGNAQGMVAHRVDIGPDGTSTVAIPLDVSGNRSHIRALLAGPERSIYTARTVSPERFGPNEVVIEQVGAQGLVRTLGPFGRSGRFNSVSALALLADGRLAVMGGIGPRHVSGEGGDDFDLHVAFYRP